MNRDARTEELSPQSAGVTAQGHAGADRSLHGLHAVKHQARKEFDQWAHSYDRSIVRHLLFDPAYRMFMEELHRWRRDLAAPFDLLDIGCGTGTWTAMVAGSPLPSRRVVGLDYSLPMTQVAHGKAAQIGEGAPTFVNADSEHLPFADASFDVITCSNSFHHYPQQEATIREMRRLLRPGGRLMLIDGFRDNVIGWFVFDVIITKIESTPAAKIFHAPWSLIREYFRRAGFRDIRHRKTNIWTPILLTVGEV
ncbi:MAG TPA: methyltransferase domain-containing protein [Phycisphaerae bacterium]|nr:methyltransferase domain-containing protein [Phycisphaerae bacterium]